MFPQNALGSSGLPFKKTSGTSLLACLCLLFIFTFWRRKCFYNRETWVKVIAPPVTNCITLSKCSDSVKKKISVSSSENGNNNAGISGLLQELNEIMCLAQVHGVMKVLRNYKLLLGVTRQMSVYFPSLFPHFNSLSKL